MSAVHEAVNKVMAKVQSIGKDQQTEQGNRFRFRGIDDVMNAVGPALREFGVIITPEYVTHTADRYLTKNGTEMENVKVTVTYRVMCVFDDSNFTAGSAGESADSGDKALPKAMSVAYRTLLLQMLCIPTDEPDPDLNVHERLSATQRAAQAAAAPPEMPTDVQSAYFALGVIANAGKDSAETIKDIAAFKAQYGQVLDQTITHEGKTLTLARLADQVATSNLK